MFATALLSPGEKIVYMVVHRRTYSVRTYSVYVYTYILYKPKRELIFSITPRRYQSSEGSRECSKF